MPLTSEDFKATVKQEADIVAIIGGYVKLRKAGAQNFSGLCPFHGEKTPSFSVHATRQFFHCFGCGLSGDVFAFVQRIENITFPEAIRLVAQKAGIEAPKASYSPEEAREARLRGSLLEMHDRAQAFFRDSLARTEGARAREYLAARGLTADTIARFGIGFAPDSGYALRDRIRADFDEPMMRESGLFSWKREEEEKAKAAGEESGGAPIYAKFRNRVMFPIHNESGRIIAFTGRTLATDDKSGPKYLNSPETAIYSKSRVLFNLHQAKEAIRKLDYAILVEGQMDCIAVFDAGFHNVIASSGTAFTDHQARTLGRFSRNVVVNFDPDNAGARAAERTLGLLVEEDFQVKVLSLETGFDPDLYIRKKGREAYADALRGSHKYFDYLIERARTQFPLRSQENRVKAVNYLLPHIQRVPSRIVRDGLALDIAQKLGIDSAVLRQELKHAAIDRSAPAIKQKFEIAINDAERILVLALAGNSHSQQAESVDFGEGAFDFNAFRQAQYAVTVERLHAGLPSESLMESLAAAAPDCSDVMEAAASEADRRLLAAVLMEAGAELTEREVDGAIKALRRIQLRRRLESVQIELQNMTARNPERMKWLLEEKTRLKLGLRDPEPISGSDCA